MQLSSTISIEAALYNENVVAWEHLIEPVIDMNSQQFSPWYFTIAIVPVSHFKSKYRDRNPIFSDFIGENLH